MRPGRILRPAMPASRLRIVSEVALSCGITFFLAGIAPVWIGEEYDTSVAVPPGASVDLDWRFTSSFGFRSRELDVLLISPPEGIAASVSEDPVAVQPFQKKVVKIRITASKSAPGPPETWGELEILVRDPAREGDGLYALRIQVYSRPYLGGGYHYNLHRGPGFVGGYPSYPLAPLLVLVAIATVLRHVNRWAKTPVRTATVQLHSNATRPPR